MFSFRKRFATLSDTIKTYSITTILLCILCVITLILTWQHEYSLTSDQLEFLGKLLMIWLVYVFASASVTKRFFEEPKKHILLQVVLLICMIAYFFIFPTDFDSPPIAFVIRHTLIQITAIVSLLVLTLWTGKRNKQSMYHGLIQIVMHSVLSSLFSLVLAGWISGALWWIEGLFSIDIIFEWYATIFAVIWIIFGGLSFLDGIRKRKIDEDEAVQPAKWKTLLGWVVWVLLLVYGVILYIYLGKIIITWERPSNIVTPISFAFSGFVVLWSILLVPLLTNENHSIVRKNILIGMYLSLIPILIMVFFAIRLRIEQYGLTEMRYIIVALLVRLVISAGYIVISKQKDLRWVSAIFTVIAIISFAGWPISASWLARIYQSNSLEDFVVQYDLKGDNGLLNTTRIALLTSDEKQKVSELIRYLVDYHGSTTMKLYYVWDAEYSHTVLRELWLPFSIRNLPESDYVYLSVEKTSWLLDIAQYSRLYKNISLYKRSRDSEIITIGSWVRVGINWSNLLLVIDTIEHTVDLDELVREFRESSDMWFNTTIARNQFIFTESWYKLLFSYINWQTKSGGIFSLEGVIFDLLVE